MARVTGVADFVAAVLNEFPERLAKCRGQRLYVQDDVDVFGGAKFQPSLLHRQGRSRPTNQDSGSGNSRTPASVAAFQSAALIAYAGHFGSVSME
ncbi:hypothetical protein [Verminephrobacter eiseniae]|uniref:hypothetical protein n=1 Tax=Verminephrobacter eiseniae TaxID=364317 RepID=UPI002238F5D3|nr:hypothetical protein [Verminephrobacter eiseniae]